MKQSAEYHANLCLIAGGCCAAPAPEFPFPNNNEISLVAHGRRDRLFSGYPAGAYGVSVSEALTVPAVSAAVQVIAEAVASLDVTVVEVDGDVETPMPDHPVTRLLRGDVNDWSSGYELIRDLVAQALCHDTGGVAWVNWVNGRPVEIIHYRPGSIEVDRLLDTGEPRFRINGREVPSRSILWLPGPFDRAPLSRAREAIGLAKMMERRAARLFDRAARPGGIVKFKNRMDEESLKLFKKNWRETHESPDANGRTAILWDDADFVPLEWKSTDQQFLEMRRFQIEEIARAFNIAPVFLGDLSRATWANLESKHKEFWSSTAEPWVKALEGALRRSLLTEEERGRLAIRFDRDDMSRADLTARATAIASLRASEVLSADEARSWLGLGPRADGRGSTYENPNINPSRD